MKTILAALVAWCALAPAAHAVTWIPQTSPTTSALNAVATSDGVTWVAVGDAGTIVRSTDGGFHWDPVTSPIADQLHAVALRDTLGLATGVGGRILRSADAGANWVEVARPTTKILFAASIEDSFAVITGEEGRLLVSLDQGRNWDTHFAGSASAFFGVGTAGEAAVAAGGAGAVAMSTFRGSAWGLTVIGEPLTFFYGVSMATSLVGWTVGTTPTATSLIARTDDGGFVWSGQTSPDPNMLFGVSALSTEVATAVGANGAIIKTVDGGAHWLSDDSGVTANLNGVAIAPGGQGVAVGAGGTILRTQSVSAVGPLPGGGAGAGVALAVLANPVGPGAAARFTLHVPAPGAWTVRVLSTTGRAVATLARGVFPAGDRALAWARTDARGAEAPAGVYFVEARSGGVATVRKFVVLE